MRTDANHWIAYECLGGCGSLTDVRVPPDRLDESNPGPTVKSCPVCDAPFDALDFRAWWPEDEGGFGSRGDGGHIPDVALDDLRRANLAAAAERMANNLEGHVSILGGRLVPSDSAILRQIAKVLRGEHRHEARIDKDVEPCVGWVPRPHRARREAHRTEGRHRSVPREAPPCLAQGRGRAERDRLRRGHPQGG